MVLKSYVLVKDHLERARTILIVEDEEARELRRIIKRVIDVIDRLQQGHDPASGNVIAFRRAVTQPRH